MKRFIFKGSLFIVPILLLQVFFIAFYSTTKGDLLRLGYIMDISGYDRNDVFKKEFNEKVCFRKISEINLSKPNKFTILTIGDSFSEQNNFGYNNCLAKKKDIKCLHYDRYLHDNPIQTLYGILNGNLFDRIKVDYIILQSVERSFVDRAKKIDTYQIINKDSISVSIKKHNLLKEKDSDVNDFFSKTIFTFPLHNIFYCFDDNAYKSDAYMVKTKNNLFSVDTNDLMFYFQDLENVKINNDLLAVAKLNTELNDLSDKLSAKGIKLIVLPCPDKYDFYYDKIVDKEVYPKPLFFQNLDAMPKKYLYLNSKKVLQEQTKYKRDMYFYDDTHWSPWAARIIADEVKKIIKL